MIPRFITIPCKLGMLSLDCGKVKRSGIVLAGQFKGRFWFCVAAAFALVLTRETTETRNRLAPITCNVRLRELIGKRWCSTRPNIRAQMKTPVPSMTKPTFRVWKYPRTATTTIAKYKTNAEAARIVGIIGYISELYHVFVLAQA
jgi:hypothetical protein